MILHILAKVTGVITVNYTYYSDKSLRKWRKFCFKGAAFVFVCALCPAYLGLSFLADMPGVSVVSVVVFTLINGVSLNIFLDGIECEMEISHRKKKKEAEELKKFETILCD